MVHPIMADQAEKLRELVRSTHKAAEETFAEIEQPPAPGPVREEEHHRARIITVTSGKGGVGKTNITASLALVLASRGQRVVIFDADLSLANVDVLLGIRPRYNLSHVISGEKRAREVLVEGPRGIRVVPASSGLQELSELHPDEFDILSRELATLTEDADTVFVDTAAGLSDNVVGFITAADEVIVVTNPEPTAYTDAYALIKVVAERQPQTDVGLLINNAFTKREADMAFTGVAGISEKFLGFKVRDLGWIPRDPTVQQAVRQQKPFVLYAPNSPASKAVRDLANKLLSRTPRPSREGFWSRLRGYFGSSAPEHDYEYGSRSTKTPG